MIKELLFVLTCYLAVTSVHLRRGKLVIDNDAGSDDAMAIFLALLYEKHFHGPRVVGLTTLNGNTNESTVCRNDQRVLKVAQRQDVPIYRGSKSSIVYTPNTDHYFGNDGMGAVDEEIIDLEPAQKQHAVDSLINLSNKYNGLLTVVAIGPLTNIALAIKLDPGFLNRLAHLYVGGGNIEKHISKSEFNVNMDVEAYHIVMQKATPDKVSVFPHSQTTEFLNITIKWRLVTLGGIDTDIIRNQNQYERINIMMDHHYGWVSLDPSVMAAVINPDLVEEYKYAKHDVILCGDNRGINTNEFVEKDEANVRIVYKVKIEEYKKFLLDVFYTSG